MFTFGKLCDVRHQGSGIVSHKGRHEAVKETKTNLTPVSEVFVIAKERPVVANDFPSLGGVVVCTQTHCPRDHRLSRKADESFILVSIELPVTRLLMEINLGEFHPSSDLRPAMVNHLTQIRTLHVYINLAVLLIVMLIIIIIIVVTFY